MNLEQIHNIYFVGIGGIGMSALARYFSSLGKNVAGYDRSESALTQELIKEGMHIHFTDNVNLIPNAFKKSSETLVILTPAVPSDHTELKFFRENHFEIKKRAEVLGIISKSQDVIAIAGTHGKTTTSTMVSHLLKNSEFDCNAFLGGISLNYQTNLLLSQKSNYVVAEADEFDRSFLHLYPKAAIITSMDADHLDIYGTYDEYKKAFINFISQIKGDGFLIINQNVNIDKNTSNIKLYTYSIDKKADFYAKDIRINDGFYCFDIVTPQTIIKDIKLGFPGKLNVENAVAAIAMAHSLGVNDQVIRNAMLSFSGVKRRFEYYIKTEKLVLIDDYGHHPEEIRYTIQSVKELYPGRRITGIFQPHLYSRTRDFADDFANSLGLLNELILLDIYPAREKPIPGITSEMLLEKVKIQNKTCCLKSKLIDFLQSQPIPDVVLMMGAGDIDRFVEPVKNLLMNKLGKAL